MKVLFLGNSEQIAFELAGRKTHIDHFTTTKDLFDREEDVEVIIVQDKEVPIFELRTMVEKMRDATFFYIISYDVRREAAIENIINICRELNVIPIGPKLSTIQKVDLILNHLDGQDDSSREKKIVSFLGTHARSGLSNLVFGTAVKLCEISEYSVVVLSLASSNPPDVFFSQPTGITLNELYTQINNNRSVIKSADLKNLLYEDERGFYFLAGNQDFTKRNHYHLDDIEYLIDMLYAEFDIVLIDAGHDPDTALTIQALLKSDMKFLNVTQHPTSSLLWKKMNEDILGRYLEITPDEFQMIINFYSPDVPRRDGRTLEGEFGMAEIARIPDCGLEGVVCEINRTLLYDIKSYKKHLQNTYQKIAMTILQRFDMLGDYVGQEAKKWSWRKA